MYYLICIMDCEDTILEQHKVDPRDLDHFFACAFERYGERINTEYIHFDVRPINF